MLTTNLQIIRVFSCISEKTTEICTSSIRILLFFTYVKSEACYLNIRQKHFYYCFSWKWLIVEFIQYSKLMSAKPFIKKKVTNPIIITIFFLYNATLSNLRNLRNLKIFARYACFLIIIRQRYLMSQQHMVIVNTWKLRLEQ